MCLKNLVLATATRKDNKLHKQLILTVSLKRSAGTHNFSPRTMATAADVELLTLFVMAPTSCNSAYAAGSIDPPKIMGRPRVSEHSTSCSDQVISY